MVLVASAACGGRVASPPAPATVTVDGVTLTLELDRGELREGDLVSATLTIRNTNNHDVVWTSGGCQIVGQVLALPPFPDPGRHWPGALGTFKSWALQHAESYAYFTDEETWRAGGRACPAVVYTNTLAAGERLRSRWVWDGKVASGLGGARRAPGGPIDVASTFFIGPQPAAKELRAVASLLIRGPADPYISPGVAIDRAYDDGRLARWLEGRPAPGETGLPGPVVGFIRLDGDVWTVRAAQKAGAPIQSQEIEVRVDARDGKVMSVSER
jgi:hypothetical protein